MGAGVLVGVGGAEGCHAIQQPTSWPSVTSSELLPLPRSGESCRVNEDTLQQRDRLPTHAAHILRLIGIDH